MTSVEWTIGGEPIGGRRIRGGRSAGRAVDGVRARFAGELMLVCLLAVVLYALAVTPVVAGFLADEAIGLMLTLLAAGVAAGAAILADQTARLESGMPDVARMSAVTAGLAVYGLVVMPLSVVRYGGPGDSPAGQVGHFVACAAVLALLAGALRRRPAHRFGRWTGLAVAAGVTVAAVLLATYLLPPESLGSGWTWFNRLILVGWEMLAIAFVVSGACGGDRFRWRLGLGFGIIAAAHLVWTISGDPVAGTAFSVLRALGVTTVLFACGTAARAALVSLRLRQNAAAEYARISVDALRRHEERSAERDHEMRNLLAGLQGVSHLLAHPGSARPGESVALGSALRAELDRFEGLLERASHVDEAGEADVPMVLTRLALLHRADGADVSLRLEPGLRMGVPASVLTQVLVNLLANCARHAPGAPVHVTSARFGSRIRIEVHDEGPGPGAAQLPTVFPRGVHDPGAGGSGLGLHLSARLLAEYGGTLRLGRSSLFSGAVAVVELPASSLRMAC